MIWKKKKNVLAFTITHLGIYTASSHSCEETLYICKKKDLVNIKSRAATQFYV